MAGFTSIPALTSTQAWPSASTAETRMYSVGGAGSTAIGNNLVVITQGSWNTVIVNSNQVNNGNVTANSTGSVPAEDSVINGEIDLND